MDQGRCSCTSGAKAAGLPNYEDDWKELHVMIPWRKQLTWGDVSRVGNCSREW
jgi:hypothetical protein